MISEEKIAVVLFGSPHNNGYTSKMLNSFKSNVNGYKFVDINAYDENIKPCIGCDKCRILDTCIYDDFNHIDMLLNTADLLVIAFPIYNLSFPAPLKSIFDRMQIYFSSRFYKNIRPPIKKEKKAVVLVTCGSNDDLGMKITRYQLKMIFSIINAHLVKEILWKNTDNDEKFDIIQEQIKLVADSINKSYDCK